MKFKRLFALLLSSIVMLGIFCVPALATTNGNTIVYSAVNDFKIPNEYLYGRQQLASMENSTYLLNLYDALYNGIENMEEKIQIDVPLPSNEVMMNQDKLNVYLDKFFDSVWYPAWEAYTNDHPEQFWWAYVQKGNNQVSPFISANFSIDTIDTEEIKLIIRPHYDSELYSKKAEFENEVKKLLYGLTSNTDEYTREKVIHDRLLAKTTYIQAEHSSCAYGAIVDGKAVCEGYARAFQYLLMRAGIFSHTVTGLAVDYEASEGDNIVSTSHAWNLVKIHGNYYYVDATWDDKEGFTSYAYFNVDDYQIIGYDHFPHDKYDIPVCTSRQYNYYVYDRGIIIDEFNTSQIANALSANGGTAHIITFDDDLFIDFFDLYEKDMKENKEIVRSLGITGGYAYGGLQTYGEIIAYLHKKNTMTVCGTVVSTDNLENTVVELIKNGEVKYSQQLTDAINDYNFNNIVLDNYTLRVSKNGHATYTEQIIGDYTISQVKNITLYLYGDVNSDGSFNLSDLVRLKKCIANSAVMNNEAFNITSSSEYSGKLVEMRKMLLSQ